MTNLGKVKSFLLYALSLFAFALAAWQTASPPGVQANVGKSCCKYATDCPLGGQICENGNYCSADKPRYCE
jgi:hypothetical protein